PTATAKPTGHEVPITIQIVSPAPGKPFEVDPGKYPGAEPSMPVLPFQAKVLVNGQETSVGTVQWESTISGKYRVRDTDASAGYRMQDFKLPAGTATTKPNEEKKIQLAPHELVGGDLVIKATYNGGPGLGNITATKTVSSLKVVGKNGPRLGVEQYIVDQSGDLAWLFLRMFCHESLHLLGQFKGGTPLYGPPSGVGVGP